MISRYWKIDINYIATSVCLQCFLEDQKVLYINEINEKSDWM